MRTKKRIKVIIEVLKEKERALSFFDEYFFDGCDTVSVYDKLSNFGFHNLKRVRGDNADLRLSQMFIALGFVENKPGMWFYREEVDTLIDLGFVDAGDILFWTSVLDEKGNKLRKEKVRSINELDIAHIKKILETQPNINKTYKQVMLKRISLNTNH